MKARILIREMLDMDHLYFVNNKDILKCTCGYLLQPPVKQCAAGHMFCSDCHQGLTVCVSCMNKLFLIPKVDAILNAILDICPYQSLGCDVQFPFYEMRKHIASCPHAYLTCPMPNCDQVPQVKSHLAQHLATEHSDFITMFKFGTQFLFAFQMDSQTKVFIEIESNHIFVIRYVARHDATHFKFFSVSLGDDLCLKYTILDRIGVCPLIVTSTIPTTAFNEMEGAIAAKGLSHQYRDDQSVLNCNFLVQLA
ncbi:uncharacterized protein LOC144558552 [Carex rostrata]